MVSNISLAEWVIRKKIAEKDKENRKPLMKFLLAIDMENVITVFLASTDY